MGAKHLLVPLIICVILTMLFLWLRENPKHRTNFNDYEKIKAEGKIKLNKKTKRRKFENGQHVDEPVILIWNNLRPGDFEKRKFRCFITNNRSMLEKSSAIIVNFKSTEERINDFPKLQLRKPSQFFILQFKETPAKYYANSKGNKYLNDPRVNGVFNMTMYFRRDSDFIYNFGSFEYALVKSYEWGYNDLPALVANKTDLVAWAVSNCDHTYGAKKRLEYAKMLIAKGLNVTTFGDCFKNNNKNENRFGFGKYKFYLAFENSLHCPDYVTEKFWRNSIINGVVPIVYGTTKEDVEAVAPPNSFIHVEDFDSPEELIKYIQYLDENDEAYLEYHKWRLMPVQQILKELDSKYDVPFKDIIMFHTAYHDLCQKLIKKQLKPKVIRNMTDWIFGKDKYVDEMCLTPYKRPRQH